MGGRRPPASPPPLHPWSYLVGGELAVVDVIAVVSCRRQLDSHVVERVVVVVTTLRVVSYPAITIITIIGVIMFIISRILVTG